MKSLSRNLIVECPWCGNEHKLGEWSDDTYLKCLNRDMKRSFIPLTEPKVFKKSSESFYFCKNCGKWSRGSKLKIVTNGENEVSGLGGDDLIETSYEQ